MVSIKVDIEFNQQETMMLNMAADVGHADFTNDQIKTIILSAALRTVNAFTSGVMNDHHTKTNPPSAIDEERRVDQRMAKLMGEVERLHARREEIRSMRLPTVRVVPPTPKR